MHQYMTNNTYGTLKENSNKNEMRYLGLGWLDFLTHKFKLGSQ